MDNIISLLEEELSCLRLILSNLALEETALLSGDLNHLVFLKQELEKLQKEEKAKRKKREDEVEKAGIQESALHEISLLGQTQALQEKIAWQLNINKELRKRCKGASPLQSLPKPLLEKKKKPPQVLDTEPPGE